MSVPSQSITVAAPAFRGLNLQQAGSLLSMEWASFATNCIIDDNGRIGVRNGWTALNAAISGTPTMKRIHEFIKANGTSLYVSAGGNKLYSGANTPTDITGTNITTPTDDAWQFVNLNGAMIGAQENHELIYWSGTGDFDKLYNQIDLRANNTAYVVGDVIRVSSADGTVYWHCTTGGTSDATEPTMNTTEGGTTADGTVTWTTVAFPVNGNACLAANGRLWVTDDNETTIYYSDLLKPWKFSGGTSGTLSMAGVWTNGMDTITAITEYNGFLVIFGKKNTVLYDSPDSVSNLALAEQIEGTGCVARDSVEHVGPYLVFLSDSGVQQLDRAIQGGGSLPFMDLSKNVRDSVVNSLAQETTPLNDVTAVYHQPTGFYLINFPTTGRIWCFDIKAPLQDGSLRATFWESLVPYGFLSTRGRDLYMTFAGGLLGKYTGYTDNGSSYDVSYWTAWSDLTQHTTNPQLAGMLQERVKIPKRLSTVLQVASGTTVQLKMQYSYIGAIQYGDSATASGGGAAEWNIAEYNIAEWGGGGVLNRAEFPCFGSGKVLRIGFTATITGELSFQQLNLLTKIGRQSL